MKKLLIGLSVAVMSMGVNADIGKTQYTQKCMGCHGATGLGIVGPALNELDYETAKARLIAYRNKENVGPRSGMMWGVSRSLGDGDIEILSKYVESL